jgi:hypothetical protein
MWCRYIQAGGRRGYNTAQVQARSQEPQLQKRTIFHPGSDHVFGQELKAYSQYEGLEGISGQVWEQHYSAFFIVLKRSVQFNLREFRMPPPSVDGGGFAGCCHRSLRSTIP